MIEKSGFLILNNGKINSSAKTYSLDKKLGKRIDSSLLEVRIDQALEWTDIHVRTLREARAPSQKAIYPKGKKPRKNSPAVTGP